MTELPVAPFPRADLESLLTTLDVDFVKLAECVVASGWRLALPSAEASAIHYNLLGTGQMVVEGLPPIAIQPHTLVIVPPGRRFHIDAQIDQQPVTRIETVESSNQSLAPSVLRRRVAGCGEPPQIVMICGYFRAVYGASIDLFGSPTSVIVEQFDQSHQLDQRLKSALKELLAQEVGMGTMATCLLKQVLVILLRRSLCSGNLWVERFPIMRDPQIARAFAEMAAHPGHPHSVKGLAQKAGLSRSAFMARFTALFGQSPMIVLRDLRIRQAHILLRVGNLSLNQVAHDVGYASRSGFIRAFRKVHGDLPLSLLKNDDDQSI